VQHLSWFAIIVGDFAITPHMALLLALIMSWINVLISRPERYTLITHPIDRYFLLFILFSLLPLLFGYSLPVNHVKRWLLFYTGVIETITFYFLLKFSLQKKILTFDKLLAAIVLTSFAAVFVALLEMYINGFSLIQIYSSRMRIGFGYHNTNLFGIHSAILYPILFYAAVYKKNILPTPIVYISLGLLIILSLLCFNRGTFLLLAVQTAMLFYYKPNRRIILWVIVLLAGTLLYFNEIILFYIIRFFLGTGIKEANSIIDQSASYRLEAWVTGLYLLIHYPLGIGAGSFQHMWELFGSRPNLFLGTPHHLFLSIGVDYGVICLIIFILILWRIYRETVNIDRADPYENAMFYRYFKISIIGFVLYGVITDGELSHLSGSTVPNNGYTLLLYGLIAAALTLKSSLTWTQSSAEGKS